MTEPSTESPTARPSPAGVAANRAAWVAALRSGDYQQATGALRVGDTYCCLGVAETARGAAWYELPSLDDVDDDVDNPVERGVDDEGTHGVRDDDGVVVATTLSRDARRWLGVRTDNPAVCVRDDTGGYYVDDLVALNDGLRLSLTEIAAVVADQPPDWDGSLEAARLDVDQRNARRDADQLRRAATDLRRATEEEL